MAKKTIVGEDGQKYTVKVKKPIYKRVWFWVLIVILGVGIGSSIGGNNTGSATNGATKSSNVPAEYVSALAKAKVYSSTMDMSKQGIYDQLTSDAGEKFSDKAAQYAVDHLKADYKKNALKKAKTYQKDMAMSPDAIHDQLISSAGDKFTDEEAQYAVDHLND